MPETKQLNPEQWVATHADYLYAFAFQRIADTELSKDLVQDTFMSAIKNKDAFKGLSAERTWLTSILKNKIIDHYRKRTAELLLQDQFEKGHTDHFFEACGHWRHMHEPQTWGMEENGHLENKELKTILEGCLRKLPALWNMVFRMKYMDDEDSKKICKELELSSSNLWVIIHRAKVNLRACISKHWINT